MNNPVLTAASYNAATGVLTFSGFNFSSGIQLNKLNWQVNGNSVALSNADTIGTIISTGFTVTLSRAHKTALNNLFTMNGLTDLAHHAYTLNATAGWDNNTGVAISNQAVSVTGYQTIALGHLTTQTNLNDTSTLHPFSTVTLTDSNTLASDTATVSFSAANGSLSGIGLSGAVINNGIATYTVWATTAADLQQILQGLVFMPTAHQGAVGSTINTVLTLTIADQVANTVLNNLSNNSTQLTVTETALPTLNSVSYNASNGQLTVSGNALTSGLLLNDLTLSAGKQSLTLNANDSISNLTASGFNVNLNSTEQSAVNAFFNSNGNGSTPYTLIASNGWDHGYGLPTSEMVTVSGAGSLTLSNFTVPSKLLDTATIQPFSTVIVTDTPFNDINETATISYTAANGTLSGTGLSGESINNGIATYTLTAINAASLQQALQGLTFTPTAHQGAAGQSYTTPLTLTINYQNQPLSTVQGICNPSMQFDSQGHLWVVNSDGYTSTVEEFSASGVLIQTLSNGINNPESLVFDSQGHLWVTNFGIWGNDSYINGSVEEFSTSGILMQTLSNGIDSPTSLVFDNQGHLWVTNSGSYDKSYNLIDNNVEEFSASGVLMQTLNNGINGFNILMFDSLGHLWVMNQGIYDSASSSYINSSIEEFSASGVLIKTLCNGINNPIGFVFDIQGHLWVANEKNVEEFSASGVLLQTLSNNISYPSLSFDSQGHLWVANEKNIEEFSASGTLIQTLVNGISTPLLSFDSQGHLWVANYETYDSFGSLINSTVEEFSASGILMQILSNGIKSPGGLLFDSQGHLWVANSFSTESTIEEFSGSGALMQTLSGGIYYPDSMVVDLQGHLWVVNDGKSTVEEFSANGLLMQTLTNGISSPQSLIFDSQGHLWVANQDINYSSGSVINKNNVEEFSASGALMQTLTNGVSLPQSLIFDSQGHLWMANQDTYDSSGSIIKKSNIEEFSTTGVLMQTLTNGVNQPQKLIFDSQGHLWVANYNTIEEFSTSGVLMQTLSSQINNPNSLVFDPQGHLWVANEGTFSSNDGNVEEFTVSGVLMQMLSSNINNPTDLVFDSQGHLWEAGTSADKWGDTSSRVYEFSTNGVLMQTLSDGIDSPTSLVFDSQGNLWVGNNSNLKEFSSSKLSQSVTYQSTQITVTETAQHLTVNPNNSINNPTVFNTVHSGDTISFADATRFTANVVTASNVLAAGGSVANLAGWVAGALSAKGANEASHNIDWFNFNGNTYLIEQANAQGSAYTTGDTLVQLVGVLNETHAGFSGHTVTLA